jgi:hypothetical protein
MAASAVTTLDLGPHKVARRVIVDAQPGEVFALIDNPHRHPELDGSGTVRPSPVWGPERLSLGDKFRVGMKQYGVPYKITSTVTALEPNRLIEWQHPMGHRWRWELVATESGTEVTEVFDYTTAKSPRMLKILGQPAKNAVGITNTLQALAARYA